MMSKVQIVSNNICYGPAPADTDEVEQHLTISSSGRVWFSAKNYQQFCDGKGVCRKKHLNIGKWKADHLLSLVFMMQEQPMVTDCGHYEVHIYEDNGLRKTIHGSMIQFSDESFKTAAHATKLLRRYIPVYALWGFDSSLSPDYEGKKAIHLFAKKWVKLLSNKTPPYKEFEYDLGEECEALGFQMDCGHEFVRLYPGYFSLDKTFDDISESITDIDVLGSAIFSQWRYLTHWTFFGYTLDKQTTSWFIAALSRMIELTKKNA